jgi:hypothetical protein
MKSCTVERMYVKKCYTQWLTCRLKQKSSFDTGSVRNANALNQFLLVWLVALNIIV